MNISVDRLRDASSEKPTHSQPRSRMADHETPLHRLPERRGIGCDLVGSIVRLDRALSKRSTDVSCVPVTTPVRFWT